MQVSVSTVSGLERRLEVAVPAARLTGEIESRLKQLARTARLKGFRPGKAPMPVVRQQFSQQVQSEVVGDLLRETYSEAITSQKLRPATDPKIEQISAEPGADMRYVALLEVMPEITLKSLSDLALERPTAEITDADQTAMIEAMRRQRPDYVAVEREAGEGDQVTVDFEGRIDGETFQGGTASDIPFVIGQGRMLKEFEDGVRGAEAGESRSVTVNFPADYGSPAVAGKTAIFSVTVKKVEEQKLPEIDDAFCAAFGVNEGGLEALKTEMLESMKRELAKAIQGKVRAQVFDKLLDANPIEVPRGMVAETVQSMQLDFARRMGLKDASQLPNPESLQEPARRRVALGLLVGEVIRAGNLKVERERVTAKLNELVGDHPSADELRRQYLQNAEAMRQIESQTLEEQVVDYVLTQAKVSDKAYSFGELTGFGQGAAP
jgi:trigger factor